jgi:hypothetical protein
MDINEHLSLYLATGNFTLDQETSDRLVELVRDGLSLGAACERLGVNRSTWYLRKREGEDPNGRTEMKWFTLRLAAAEVSAAKQNLRTVANTLGVDVQRFPHLLELQVSLD